jgi:hypothetical protein
VSRKSITGLQGSYCDGRVVLNWYKSVPHYEKNESAEFSEFRIYRRKISEFVFGADYDEFFCDCYGDFGTLIYRGKVKCEDNNKFTFYDRTVTVGEDYAYFIRSRRSPAIGPLPLRVRDHAIWWPYKKLLQRMEKIKKEYKGLVIAGFCGRTVKGNKIPYLKVGNGKPVLGLIGAVHAGESGPELIIPILEDLLKKNENIFKTRSIIAVPSVNIDAREKLVQGTPWYLRTNANGVDLNRNFPGNWEIIGKGYGLSTADPHSETYRGPYPASEPETQGIMRLLSEYRPPVVLSFHHLAGICGLPALAFDKAKKNKAYQERCEKIVRLYGQGLYPEKKYNPQWLQFGATAGSLASWLFLEFKIPCFDLELWSSFDRLAFDKCVQDKTDRALLKEYQLRHQRAIQNVLTLD